MSIADRLARVQARVQEAVARRGAGPRVQLIGVSKRHPASAIREAAAAGLVQLGENYAQELRDKRLELDTQLPDLCWHFIGALQRNKVKHVVGCTLIHTVDRHELLEMIDSRASGLNLVQPVLIQVNIGREPQKSGVPPDQVAQLLATFAALPHVRCEGLMAIPPAGTAQQTVPHFRAMRGLRDTLLGTALPPNVDLHGLSMGMSDDFEAAIAEGATHVRVGTAIFGSRAG